MKYLLLPLLLGSVHYSTAQELPGLVFKSTMNNSCEMKDEASGLPSNGVLVDVMLSPDRNNAPNSALAFNSNTSYVTLGVVEKLRLTGDRSISFWVKPSLTGANRTGSIFTYGTGIKIGYEELNAVARLNISFGNTLYLSVNLTQDQWQPVTITFIKDYSATRSKAYAYIDGVQIAEAEQNKSVQDYTNSLALIGPVSQTSLTNGFQGGLDELKIYDRALTAAEVLNAVLPVKLEFFKAKSVNGVVELSWKTSAEDNAGYFAVQRSGDGINFETITNVPAGRFNYVTYDAGAGKISWYRLQIVDKDGKKEFSQIIKADTGDVSEFPIKIFPNPASAKINFAGIPSSYTVNIVSANGSIVKRQRAVSNIDIVDLHPGLYFIIIYDGVGNKKMISKFIKR